MKTFSINQATTDAAFKQAGFTELKEIFNNAGTVQLSSGAIRKALIDNYNFTEGQAAGTIRRACLKKLLFSIGNAEYMFNIDFPHSVAPYIAEVCNADADMLNDENVEIMSAEERYRALSADIPDTRCYCKLNTGIYAAVNADIIDDNDRVRKEFRNAIKSATHNAGLITNITTAEAINVENYHKLLCCLNMFADEEAVDAEPDEMIFDILVNKFNDSELLIVLHDAIQTAISDFGNEYSIAALNTDSFKWIYGRITTVNDMLFKIEEAVGRIQREEFNIADYNMNV